jgi:hypothetical protein
MLLELDAFRIGRLHIGVRDPTFKEGIGKRSFFGSRFAAEVRCRAAGDEGSYSGPATPSSQRPVLMVFQMLAGDFGELL